MPADILAMLAAGWNASPSTYGRSSASASSLPAVVLPVPATPITTSTLWVPLTSYLAVFVDIGSCALTEAH